MEKENDTIIIINPPEKKDYKTIIIAFIITLLLLTPLIVYTINDYKKVQEFNKKVNNYSERVGVYYEIDDNTTFYIYDNEGNLKRVDGGNDE